MSRSRRRCLLLSGRRSVTSALRWDVGVILDGRNLFLSADNDAPADKPAEPESDLRATLEHVERLHLEQQAALDELRAHTARLERA
jgi:hypothetical protein